MSGKSCVSGRVAEADIRVDVPGRYQDPDAPLRLMPVMKLASKYEIDAMRKRIVALVEDTWPRSLEQWLLFHAQANVIQDTYDVADGQFICGKDFARRVPEPAVAVCIVRDFDIPSVLPCAYYTLACISFDHDWGTNEKPSLPLALGYALARWHMLDIVDMETVLRGWEELVRIMALNVRWASVKRVRDVLESCMGCDDFCQIKASAIQVRWKRSVSVDFREVQCSDPLGILQGIYEEHSQWEVCYMCTAALKRCVRSQQEYIWGRLSEIFGVNC